jgi:hypothetical protein
MERGGFEGSVERGQATAGRLGALAGGSSEGLQEAADAAHIIPEELPGRHAWGAVFVLPEPRFKHQNTRKPARESDAGGPVRGRHHIPAAAQLRRGGVGVV